MRPDAAQYRKSVQAVFQDPYASLNPRMRVSAIIAEPLITNETRRRRPRCASACWSCSTWSACPSARPISSRTSSPAASASASPSPARWSLSPRLVVLDEPVSALDVSIRAQILNLLRDLQARLGLSYLFIAHDLAAVAHMSHEIVVMYLGKIVESGEARDARQRPAASLHQGAVLGRPAAAIPTSGARRSCWPARCRARSTRRPAATSIRAARTPCRAARSEMPPLAPVEGRMVACHLYG